MINDKKIYGTDMESYLNELNSAKNASEMTDIITKNRQALYDLFQIDIAEGEGETAETLKKGDQELLEKISIKLKERKKSYEEIFGTTKNLDGTENKDGFDLRSDASIFGLWKTIENSKIDPEAFPAKNEDIKNKIHDTIKEFNKLQRKIAKKATTVNDGEFATTPKLLKSKSNGEDDDDVLGNNNLEEILSQPQTPETEKKLSNLIEQGGDGLNIVTGVGGLKDKNNQIISRRIFVGLWLLYYAAEHATQVMDATTLDSIQRYIKQVADKELPTLRTIHGIDHQTHYTDDLHDKLRDLNAKDPAREAHTIKEDQATTAITSDLTALFENGKATGIENYAFVPDKIVVTNKDNQPLAGKIVLRDMAGQDNTSAETKNNKVQRKIVLQYGGQEITIGEIGMDNRTLGKASLAAKFYDLPSLVASLGDQMPLSLSVPVKAIKQAKVKDHNAARTKYIDIQLDKKSDIIIVDPPVNEPPIDEPAIAKSVDVNASLSNTFVVREAIAERKAGDELREEWKSTGWINAPKKLNLFLRRKSIKDGLVKKHLKYTDYDATGKLNRDPDSVSAAHRHGIEAEQGFNDRVENVLGQMVGIENDYPNTYKKIVELSEQYLGNAANRRNSGMTEADFQTKFQDILQRSNAYDPTRPSTATMADGKWKPLNELLKTNDMSQLSTNILQQINGFKAHKILVNKIYRVIGGAYTSHPNWEVTGHADQTSMNAALKSGIDPLIKNYIKDYHIMPSFLKSLKLNLDDPNVMLQLAKLSKHHNALTAIQAQTLNLKLQIFNKGEEAYDVQENLNRLAKTGRRLDDPFKNSKYFKKRPGFKKFMGYVWGATKIGALVAPGMVAASMGAPLLAYAGVYGAAAFTQTFFKKYSHYNKEHRLYQRKQATMVNTTRQEREAVFNAVQNMNRREGRFWGEKLQTRRKLKYYINTTHDQLDLSKDLVANMIAAIETLDASGNPGLKDQASDALARLDYHKKTGQNFLGSDIPTEAEKEYKELQQLVITACDRLGIPVNDLRSHPSYQTVTTIIEGGVGSGDTYKNQGYTKARNRFKKRESRQAIIGATKAGAVAFGMAYAMGALTSKNASSETNVTGNNNFKAEFELGKYRDVNYSGGNLEADLTTFLNNTSNVQSGGQLNMHLTGSTDLTRVINPTSFDAAAYEAWKNDVISHIQTLRTSGSLHPNYATQLETWVNGNRSSLPSSFTGHVNDNLAAQRVLTGVRETADALSASTNTAVNSGSLTLNLSAGGSALPTSTYNQSERFVSAAIEAVKENQIAGHNGYGVGIGWDNTFDINKEPENREGQIQ